MAALVIAALNLVAAIVNAAKKRDGGSVAPISRVPLSARRGGALTRFRLRFARGVLVGA